MATLDDAPRLTRKERIYLKEGELLKKKPFYKVYLL
ncbi:hypothetical protein NEOC65_001546 [Neochlamydia sp. AcF65]|nr:hypothetical protein [Neochlamydia sp. AcF65]